jgi:hypothetical protein
VHNDDLERWLGFSDPHEHPVVLQLGGNDPAALAHAVAKSRRYNYAAVNLNCGCPSERVAGGGERANAWCGQGYACARVFLFVNLCARASYATRAPAYQRRPCGVPFVFAAASAAANPL